MTDAEAEAPILRPPDANSQLIGKTLMLGKIKGRRRKGQQSMRRLNGTSAKLAGKKAPQSSAKLFLSRGMVTEYLPCSLAAPAACD